MKRTAWLGLTLLGACVLATTASAESVAPAALSTLQPAYLAGNWGTASFADGGQRSEYRRYYRRHENEYDRGINGWLDVRGGFFDSQDVSKNDWTAGIKVAGKVTPELSFGITTDLHRRTHADRVVTSQFTDPTGHVVTTSSEATDAESNLVPVLGIFEVHLPTTSGVDPYFGAGAGWEFLNVRVHDFQNGIDFVDEANYDGPGYQAFGGLAFPVGQRARFTAEGYWNGSTVKRDARDPNTGQLEEERIDVNGWGGRAGLGFAF